MQSYTRSMLRYMVSFSLRPLCHRVKAPDNYFMGGREVSVTGPDAAE